jgi:hypothetical protein
VHSGKETGYLTRHTNPFHQCICRICLYVMAIPVAKPLAVGWVWAGYYLTDTLVRGTILRFYKTLSFSRTADPVFFQPALVKNHNPDFFAPGKSPHTVVIDLLDMPEPVF